MEQHSPLFDLNQLNELAAGNPEFVGVMVDTFLTHTPSQVEQLVLSFEQGDLKRMGEVAHKLKPSIDLFGIERLQTTVRSIEQKGKAEHKDEKLPLEVEQLNSVMGEVFSELKKLLPK